MLFFLVSTCLFVAFFWLFQFQVDFKYIFLIMEIEYQRMDKILEAGS